MLSVNGILLKVDKLNVGKIVSKIQMAVTTTVDDVDLDKTCRICLMKYELDKLFYLFGSNKMFQDLSIASAIFDCFGIDLKQDKILPSYVCIKCASSTLQSYTFKKCLIKCQQYLEKLEEQKTESTLTQTKSINFKNEDSLTEPQEKCNAPSGKIAIKQFKSSEYIEHTSNNALHTGKSCNLFLSASTTMIDHNYSKIAAAEEIDDTTLNAIKSNSNNNESVSDKASLNVQQDRNSESENIETPPPGPPYKCQICGREYGVNFRSFYCHVRSHYVYKVPCTFCGKRFTRNKLEIHLRTHTKEKPYQCSQCSARFTIMGNLKRHMTCHTGDKSYMCDICGRAYRQLNSLENHMQSHSEQTSFVCTYCGDIFASNGSHQSHLLLHHNENESVQSTKSFPKGSNKEEEEKNTKACVCNVCGRVFRKNISLRIHSRIHSQAYSCNLCYRRKFTLYANYEVHMYWHAVKATTLSVTPLTCKYCEKVFDDKNELMVHIPTHREKPFSCNYCDKSFLRKIALLYHLRQHYDVRPFTCSVCGKTFRYITTLKQHVKVHTGEKPYRCEICSRRFVQQQQLTSHMFTHTGEKKYKCPFCEKAFALNGNLTVHKRRHTGERPYICDVCGKGFYDSSTMKKHKQAQHKNSFISQSENVSK